MPVSTRTSFETITDFLIADREGPEPCKQFVETRIGRAWLQPCR